MVLLERKSLKRVPLSMFISSTTFIIFFFFDIIKSLFELLIHLSIK